MKIRSSLIAAVALLVAATGCTLSTPGASSTGSPSTAPGTAAPSTAGSAPVSGPLRVGIASREIVNDYNRDIIAGAQAVIKKAGGTSTVTDGQGNQTNQINNIESLINSGVNGLIIQLGDPGQLAPVVAKARAKGINVVTTSIGSQVSGTLTDVGGDEELMAEMMGRALLSSINYQGDVYAFWVPGAPLLETRLRVFQAMLKNYPKVKLHLEPSDFSPAKVQSQMQAVLTAHPNKGDIAGVWGAYDQMTSGAVQAIQQARRSEIKVTSIDGDRATFPMLYGADSPFVATVVQNAQNIGGIAADILVKAVNGQSANLPPSTYTTAWLATRNNGVAAAEERYGSGFWAQAKLDKAAIEKRYAQNQKVVIVSPVLPAS
ncbi:MAG: periplasmic binding domain protein [Sphaerisporangium sp.]|nr:periplasmic binding domain protein [Sphaerisporangium sp.]